MSEARTTRAASSLRVLANHRVESEETPAVSVGRGSAPVTDGRRSSRRPRGPDHMCGQRALAFACGQQLESIVEAIGHSGPLTVREIRTFFERHTRFKPTELSRAALNLRPAETWWSFGARRFLAVLVQFDAGRADGMGHAFVLDGRTLLDPDCVDGDIMRRVQPATLARFDHAFVLSAHEDDRD